MKDYLLKIDEYGKPKVSEGYEAVGLLIIKLFMMNPGEDELHPDMGLGFVKNYKYSSMDDFSDLKLNAQKQIEKYLPILQNVSIDIQKDLKNREIRILIRSDNTVYSLMTDNEELKLSDF